MVLKAKKFTPEVLLSLPRPSAAVPNRDATLALYTVTQYSFESHSETKEVRILSLDTGISTLFTNDSNAHDAVWLGDGTNAIMWLQSGAKSITSLMIGDADEPTKPSYTADVILAPFSNLKVKPLGDGTIAVAMTGLATTGGSLYNDETAEKGCSTARIYETNPVRFWDAYITPQRKVIWYSKLAKSKGMYSLAAPVHNALKGTEFESPIFESLGDPLEDFAIGTSGIVFNAKDPSINLGFNNKSDIYFIPLKTFTEAETPKPRPIDTGTYDGAASCVRFSPDGKQIIFLRNARNHWTTRGIRVMLVSNISESLQSTEILRSGDGNGEWPLTPSSVTWSSDGKEIYLIADDMGRVALFKMSAGSTLGTMPERISSDGSVSHVAPLERKSQLLVTSSSFVENSLFQIVGLSDLSQSRTVSSSSRSGSRLGLSQKQVSEIHYQGSGHQKVHAWILKPSSFSTTKRYPLAVLIHGGPNGAWNNGWSTRWNLAAFAEQGYIVVAPNIRGSIGYGQKFADDVTGEYGGQPYQDLEMLFEYVKTHLDYVDTENAVALGASYGGYMINWIQGNELGRKFKALVCHDGIFNTLVPSTGDSVSSKANLGGPLYPWTYQRDPWKWNPARPDLVASWDTPMLIIHSDRDYRCTIEGGLSAFDVLQQNRVPSKFLNFPDENHFVLKPENSLVWHKTVFDWINKYSGIGNKHGSD